MYIGFCNHHKSVRLFVHWFTRLGNVHFFIRNRADFVNQSQSVLKMFKQQKRSQNKISQRSLIYYYLECRFRTKIGFKKIFSAFLVVWLLCDLFAAIKILRENCVDNILCQQEVYITQ